MDKVSDKEAD